MIEILIGIFALLILGVLIGGIFRGSLGMKLVCGAVLLLLLFSLFPIRLLWPQDQRVACTVCGNNLRQLAMVAMEYQEEHGGVGPTSIVQVAEIDDAAELFVCESAGGRIGDPADVASWTDYAFFLPPGTNGIFAYCPPENHRGKLGVYVTSSGSVMMMTPDRYRKLFGKKAE